MFSTSCAVLSQKHYVFFIVQPLGGPSQSVIILKFRELLGVLQVVKQAVTFFDKSLSEREKAVGTQGVLGLTNAGQVIYLGE